VTVSRQPAGYTCAVSGGDDGSGGGTIAGANVTSVTVSCSPSEPAPSRYTVGGTVTGLTGTLVLQDGGGDALTVTADGPFTFATSLVDGSSFAVTVASQPSGETCTVSGGADGSGGGTISGANVTGVAVTCTGNASSSQVATPTLSPDPGSYDVSELWAVTLSDATPGAQIYYTFDGSDPTNGSILYTGPIDVTVAATGLPTTTIRAVAVASGLSNSEIATGTYNLTQTYGGSCLVNNLTGAFDGTCIAPTYLTCFDGYSPQCVGAPTGYVVSSCGIPVSGSCSLTAPAIQPF